jgi:hypothetical protein
MPIEVAAQRARDRRTTGKFIAIGAGIGALSTLLVQRFGAPGYLQIVDIPIGAGLGAALAIVLRKRRATHV